jgi:hypothetical protein
MSRYGHHCWTSAIASTQSRIAAVPPISVITWAVASMTLRQVARSALLRLLLSRPQPLDAPVGQVSG